MDEQEAGLEEALTILIETINTHSEAIETLSGRIAILEKSFMGEGK